MEWDENGFHHVSKVASSSVDISVATCFDRSKSSMDVVAEAAGAAEIEALLDNSQEDDSDDSSASSEGDAAGDSDVQLASTSQQVQIH